MNTKKAIGTDISSTDIIKLTDHITAFLKNQKDNIIPFENYIYFIIQSVIRSEDVPNHIDQFLKGEYVTVFKNVYIEGKMISFPRVNTFRVNSIPMGTENGFIIESSSRPLPAIAIYTWENDTPVLNINITENFYIRHTKFRKENPFVLAQLIMHELYEQIGNASHIEAVLIESQYNSFETATNQVSDLTMDILESAARDDDFVYLQNLVDNTDLYKQELKSRYTNQLSKNVMDQAEHMADKIKMEAKLLLDLNNFKSINDEKFEIKPQNILCNSKITAIMDEEDTTATLRVPAFMKDVMAESLKEFNQKIFTARIINAYIQPKKNVKNQNLHTRIKKWVEKFIEFSELNSNTLRSLGMTKYNPSNIFHSIKHLLLLHDEITGNKSSLVNELCELQKCQDIHDRDNINRFINSIHRDVLDAIFGVFKTSTGKKVKECIEEIESISGTILSLLVNECDNHSITGYGFVKVIDLEDTINRETSIGREIALKIAFIHPWRRGTNIYSIFAGTKVWFFTDLGIHTANVFIDINPLDRKIDITFAELENTLGNQKRLEFVTELFETIIGIKAKRTNLSVSIRFDKRSKKEPISINELIHKASRVLQSLTYLVDLDEYLSTGEIPYNALIGQLERLCHSDTGFALYNLRHKYFLDSYRKRRAIITRINTILNEQLHLLGLKKIPDNCFGQDLIDIYFNKALLDYKVVGMLMPGIQTNRRVKQKNMAPSSEPSSI